MTLCSIRNSCDVSNSPSSALLQYFPPSVVRTYRRPMRTDLSHHPSVRYIFKKHSSINEGEREEEEDPPKRVTRVSEASVKSPQLVDHKSFVKYHQTSCLTVFVLVDENIFIRIAALDIRFFLFSIVSFRDCHFVKLINFESYCLCLCSTVYVFVHLSLSFFTCLSFLTCICLCLC